MVGAIHELPLHFFCVRACLRSFYSIQLHLKIIIYYDFTRILVWVNKLSQHHLAKCTTFSPLMTQQKRQKY